MADHQNERVARGLSRFCVQCCERPSNYTDPERCTDCVEHPGPARFHSMTGERLDGTPAHVRRPLLSSSAFQLDNGNRQVIRPPGASPSGE